MTRNLLFLCTGNSARSILAEALLNRSGKGRFRAFSAGSQPKGEPHPMALEVLRSHGFSTVGLRSKSWDEFAAADAPKMDYIITVCSNAAGEICPIWPGHPTTGHWGIDDPAAVDAPEQREAFERAYREVEERIEKFLAIPAEDLPNNEIRTRIAEIGATSSGAVLA